MPVFTAGMVVRVNIGDTHSSKVSELFYPGPFEFEGIQYEMATEERPLSQCAPQDRVRHGDVWCVVFGGAGKKYLVPVESQHQPMSGSGDLSQKIVPKDQNILVQVLVFKSVA